MFVCVNSHLLKFDNLHEYKAGLDKNIDKSEKEHFKKYSKSRMLAFYKFLDFFKKYAGKI